MQKVQQERKRDAKRLSIPIESKNFFTSRFDFCGLAIPARGQISSSGDFLDFGLHQSLNPTLAWPNLQKGDEVEFSKLETNHYPSQLLQASYFASTGSSPILSYNHDKDLHNQKNCFAAFEDHSGCFERSETDSISCSSSIQASPKKFQKKRGRKIGSFRKTPKILKNFVSINKMKVSLREKITLSVKENILCTDRTISVFSPEFQSELTKNSTFKSRHRPCSDFSSLMCSKLITKTKQASLPKSPKARITCCKQPDCLAEQEQCLENSGPIFAPAIHEIVNLAKSKTSLLDLEELKRTLCKLRESSLQVCQIDQV